MTITEIYDKFAIPPNLREHMLRVYGVVCFIEKHWKGEPVNWDLAKKAALLHDLGNAVKFDLDAHPEFLGEEQMNVEHWKEVQRQIIEKYGSDDHETTGKMLEEIGADRQLIDIIQAKSFGNSVESSKSDSWPLKIMYYGDMRALPFGIGTLEERIDDVRNRMPKYTSRPDFEDLINACRDIENQIAANLDMPVSEINENSIKTESPSALVY